MHIYMMWGEWAVDLSAYYYAGHFFAEGNFDQIYAGPPQIIGPEMPQAWKTAVAMDGHADDQTYPFIYLPWVAAIMAPISEWFAPMTVMNAGLVINLTLMVWSCWLAYRIVEPKRVPLWVWAVLSGALLTNSASSVLAIALGQVQILVFFLCLLAFERYKAGAFWVAGAALALAAGLKITPAAFAIIFLWDRNSRALISMGLVTFLLGVFSWSVAGAELHKTYFDLMARLNDQIFIAAIAFSIEGFVYQLSSLVTGTAEVLTTHEYTYPKPNWIDSLAKAMFVTGLVAIWVTTRNLERGTRIARQLFALSLLVPLAAPLGWVHYFLLTTYMMPGLSEHVRGRASSILIAGFLFALNGVIFYLLFFVGEFRAFPQLIVCVPFLFTLLLALLFMGKRETQSRSVVRGEMLPAE